MSDRQSFDTRFSLPAIDDPPLTETGVILMGLDAERLLAGLGLAASTDSTDSTHSTDSADDAALAEDPALVALAVDRLRHGARQPMPFDAAVAAGVRCWRGARPALAAADPHPAPVAAPRRAWTQASRLFATAELGEVGSATRAYLTACWLRRHDVDRYTDLPMS